MRFLLCFSLFGDVNSKRNKLYILEEDYNNNLPPGKFFITILYFISCYTHTIIKTHTVIKDTEAFSSDIACVN